MGNKACVHTAVRLARGLSIDAGIACTGDTCAVSSTCVSTHRMQASARPRAGCTQAGGGSLVCLQIHVRLCALVCEGSDFSLCSACAEHACA